MKSNVRTRLKTGDEVVVIAGRDVGKTGTCLLYTSPSPRD